MRNPFRYFKTSPEIIRLAVMMYVRLPLSLRQVEDLLHERGVDICHETLRFWWNRFGPMFAVEIRKRRVDRRSYSSWQWHLDEVFVRINGETHYLWRATDRLRSYRAAMNVIGNASAQICGRWLNNRAEYSHQPFRRREGAMAKFRDNKTLQKFASAHASIHNHFNLERHLNHREIFKQNRSAALAEWRQLAA